MPSDSMVIQTSEIFRNESLVAWSTVEHVEVVLISEFRDRDHFNI